MANIWVDNENIGVGLPAMSAKKRITMQNGNPKHGFTDRKVFKTPAVATTSKDSNKDFWFDYQDHPKCLSKCTKRIAEQWANNQLQSDDLFHHLFKDVETSYKSVDDVFNIPKIYIFDDDFAQVPDANPIVGLFDPACFVVNNTNCPNENITFWLYSKETADKPILLNPLELNPWHFKPTRPLKILVHGYTGYRDFAPSSYIRPVLLDNEDVYVISIDYGPLVRYPCYVQAVRNAPLVSQCLAQLINNLVDQGIVENSQIHIIGFSLGSQVAGQTANYVRRKLKHITGLDPAKPLFITGSNSRRLDAEDAEFVDVIHTDVFARGMLRSMGHVDFYPNLGLTQPGCMEDNPSDPSSCNHERAPIYYAESINSTKGFWGRRCSSWLIYLIGLCPTQGSQAQMGYHVEKGIQGSYFLKTDSKSPYALGKTEDVDNSKFLAKFKLSAVHNEIDHDFEPEVEDKIVDLSENDIELEKKLFLDETYEDELL
ncbi:pancreatic triacylglycerol lipase-like [Drosophila tropicalis]|uniref:pancreatic triacylglycerol lipase-like n=1 Tax=Drosophila tropicalis TaxID=46794 RepID=UPI0035ABBA96